jgi:hypothetical protein
MGAECVQRTGHALRRATLTERAAVLARQQKGGNEAVAVAAECCGEASGRGPVTRCIGCSRLNKPQPYRHAQAVAFQRRADIETTKQENLVRAGIADCGKRLQKSAGACGR